MPSENAVWPRFLKFVAALDEQMTAYTREGTSGPEQRIGRTKRVVDRAFQAARRS